VNLPDVQLADWAKNPIDRFILARMEAAGLAPSQPADRQTFVRRLTFDLTGWPPTPEEVAAFVNNPADDEEALAALVDRLLDSPHFGERWARHWLDVARYADSDGYESDADRPAAYQYRDFVIRAFNRDMPFDQFVRWQLAGDEYAPDNSEALAATGFLAASPVITYISKVAAETARYRMEDLDNMLSTTGSALLGLTIGCARCHDHKFDPISQRDFYRMLAAFTTTERRDVEIGRDGAGNPIHALVLTDQRPEAMVTHLLERGDPTLPAERVTLGFLRVLTPPEIDGEAAFWCSSPPEGAKTTWQRRAMAAWITDLEQGAGSLLARVIVNRIWQYHFGTGLVRTSSDFGTQGTPPTHPELLEWLAGELVRCGWRLKPLHRLIVTSATYRQANQYDPDNAAADPENALLWHRRPQRLEIEAVRDSILAVSGGLDPTMFGPAIKPYVPPEAMAGRNKDDKVERPSEDAPEQWRRTIYLFTKRSIPTPMLEVFDAPDSDVSCARRSESTVAPQALALLNDPFVRRQAKLFAERVQREAEDREEDFIEHAFQLALGRPPGEHEMAAASEFLKRADDRAAALTDLCHSLFTVNEFMYVD
jgi:hypothetical protein